MKDNIFNGIKNYLNILRIDVATRECGVDFFELSLGLLSPLLN